MITMPVNSRKVFTLMDLLEINAEAYWRLSSNVGQLIVQLETNIPSLDQVGPALRELKGEVEKLGIRQASIQIDRISDLVNKGQWYTRSELAASMRSLILDLHLRIIDDLENRFFILLDTSLVASYKQSLPLFGVSVDSSFSNASFDVSEAGKCFALHRDTACVFHLMRTLESGIEGARRCLGIPDPVKDADRNWGAMLRKFKDEIERRDKASPRLWNNQDRDFFAEVYVSLDAVRNVWRNSTMHLEKKYTSEEAANIMAAVQALMRKLAARLDQNGQPLA